MNLIAEIESLLEAPARCGSVHIIAVDGPAGAGKTTFATNLYSALSGHRNVELLHLDQIYAGWELALTSTLTDSLSELLSQLEAGRSAVLPTFDWSTEMFRGSRIIEPCEVLIIEGVGSAQSIVREYASATIWLDIDPATGFRRVVDRDGDQVAAHMKRWQSEEILLFESDATRENADFVLSTL